MTVKPKDLTLEQLEIWFQDETRVGQQGSRTRIWTTTGTRARIVKQQQFLIVIFTVLYVGTVAV